MSEAQGMQKYWREEEKVIPTLCIECVFMQTLGEKLNMPKANLTLAFT